eukprot:349216-Rhodomonas_salina.1
MYPDTVYPDESLKTVKISLLASGKPCSVGKALLRFPDASEQSFPKTKIKVASCSMSNTKTRNHERRPTYPTRTRVHVYPGYPGTRPATNGCTFDGTEVLFTTLKSKNSGIDWYMYPGTSVPELAIAITTTISISITTIELGRSFDRCSN